MTKNKICSLFPFCAILFFTITTLLFSAPAQAQGLQFVYIFNDVQMAQESPKPPKCVEPNPAECVWAIPNEFDSRGCPKIQYCVDKDHDKTICLEGRCVECITNADCLITEPICQNNVCVPCPDGMKYDKEKKECVCPEPLHEDNGICCGFGQFNENGSCVCQPGRTVCGDNCCVSGETCYDNTTCCKTELCNGVCCPTGTECIGNSICGCADGQEPNSDGVCCAEGEKLVDYFTTAGVRQQTCCPKNLMGADAEGHCCPEGLVGAFGHNHSLVYSSRCCPKEGQEDKGMIGLAGLAETYTCAPPDTTMDATGDEHAPAYDTGYVPIGSKNTDNRLYACGPEEKRTGSLHNHCGSAGYYCTNGQGNATTEMDGNPYTCFCTGTVDEGGVCHLLDCWKPRQHIAYCYCNPNKGSVLEFNYAGGTWRKGYSNDVCVTPQNPDEECTKGITFMLNGYCQDCKTNISASANQKSCNNCAESYWNGSSCVVCKNGYANTEKTECICGSDEYNDNAGYCRSCDNTSYQITNAYNCHVCDNSTQRFMDTSNYCWLCSYTSYRTTSVEECHSCTDNKRFMNTSNNCYSCDFTSYETTTPEECYRCPAGKTMWSEYGGYKYCFSCQYAGGSYAWFTETECDRCPNRVWTESANGLGTCYLE